jgi:[protein-PII] uridylyltransferase
MSSTPHLRANVVAARQRLAEGREKLRQRHQKGSPGIQVSRAMTELFDAIVLDLYQAALVDLHEDREGGVATQIALVAHGGYGRADIAPYSDVDMMILYEPGALSHVAPLAERMVRDVFDVGLVLGQSVRTPQDAWKLAREDATICTSLTESRFLTGNEVLFQKFTRHFQTLAQRRAKSLMAAITRSRGDERQQFGETVYLLEPNVKRSPGGLREIQLLRWIGFARYGNADPDGLRLMGHLDREDYERQRSALEFLLRLRNEMHFAAGRSNDQLDRAEQLRVAETFGFAGTEGLLPVEQFMREYFRHTNRVSDIVSRFIRNAQSGPAWKQFLAPLFSHQFERDFRIEPYQITANKRGLAKLSRDLAEILRLADVANRYDKPISHATCEAIRTAAVKLPAEVSPEAAGRFISLISQPARLGELLHRLHNMGVLEKIIPSFAHARSLLQFNVYHKYTVDEHSIRAVHEATRFQYDTGPLGSVYKHLKRKWLLHLALLIHDLGKGYVEDHSEVGARIAAETGAQLRLSQADTETLVFLVHKHLMMSHLAFRRDTSDDQLIIRFAVEVGSPEVLEMLFLLSAADLAAVGPGVLNAWKIEVLADLFHRAIKHLGGEDPTLDLQTRLDFRRNDVVALLRGDDDHEWFEKQLEALPSHYLQQTLPDQIVTDLRQLRAIGPNQAAAAGRYQPETRTVEYQIGTYENITPGVFHKLTGALSSQGLQILSAEINTLADGLVFDRFCVNDTDFAGEPPPDRLADVSRALITAISQSSSGAPAFRRVWRPADERRSATLTPLPTRVQMDNSNSERYTIVDIFAADRMGLLYTITRTLFELGLSVSVAKIGTYLDQVVDVFYVTDHQGQKIEQEDRLHQIRTRLLEAVAELERSENEQEQQKALGRR